MITFKDFLLEAQGANKHLEHIEDEVLNSGFEGVKKAITYLSSLGSTLKGSSSKKIKITTKWDGAPAIVACLLYTSPSPRDLSTSRMPSSA